MSAGAAVQAASAAIPNVHAAVSYAEEHAKDQNTTDDSYFDGGDCTNFVSQILYAGGVSQAVYSRQDQGWWHNIREII